jgi:hypothetical protein
VTSPAGDAIRRTIHRTLRADHHPARTVPCPHCGAHEHQPCTTISKRRRKTDPCPSRITAWARTTSVCPTCQVEPGIDCHLDGWPLAGGDVHQERTALAGEAA